MYTDQVDDRALKCVYKKASPAEDFSWRPQGLACNTIQKNSTDQQYTASPRRNEDDVDIGDFGGKKGKGKKGKGSINDKKGTQLKEQSQQQVEVGAISCKTDGKNPQDKGKAKKKGKGKGVSCFEGGDDDKSRTSQQCTTALTTMDEGWILGLTSEPTMNGEYLGYRKLLIDTGVHTHVCPMNFANHVPFESPIGGGVLKSVTTKATERVGIRRVPFRWTTSDRTQKVTRFTVADVQRPNLSVGELMKAGVTATVADSGCSVQKSGTTAKCQR